MIGELLGNLTTSAAFEPHPLVRPSSPSLKNHPARTEVFRIRTLGTRRVKSRYRADKVEWIDYLKIKGHK